MRATEIGQSIDGADADLVKRRPRSVLVCVYCAGEILRDIIDT
jgi:hypothetical protein